MAQVIIFHGHQAFIGLRSQLIGDLGIIYSCVCGNFFLFPVVFLRVLLLLCLFFFLRITAYAYGKRTGYVLFVLIFKGIIGL